MIRSVAYIGTDGSSLELNESGLVVYTPPSPNVQPITMRAETPVGIKSMYTMYASSREKAGIVAVMLDGSVKFRGVTYTPSTKQMS